VWFRYKQHSLIPLLLGRAAKVTDIDTRTGCTALHYVLQYPGTTSCQLVLSLSRLLRFSVVLLFPVVVFKRQCS